MQFHRRRAGKWVHPDHLREAEAEDFLTHLAVDRRLAASSQSQALCALVFLYREVLGQPLGRLRATRAKRPERLPTVLSREEVKRILSALTGVNRLLADLMYGAGLRVMEALRLRVKDVDFGQRHLLIRDRQGSSFPAGIRRFRAVADRQMASRRNGPRKTTTRVTRS